VGPEQFLPISDALNFPVLTAGFDLPCGDLMGCESLAFYSFGKSATAITLQEGRDWHLYGDTRWPSLSSWVEIETTPADFYGHSGVLVVTHEIPEDESDPLAWAVHSGPLQHLFPAYRAEADIRSRLDALRRQAAAIDLAPGPIDARPRFVQSYCIYRGISEIKLIASYTDLLNCDGVVIPRFRMASVNSRDIEVCRFTLHALFCLNESRLGGMEYKAVHQLETFEALSLQPGAKNPGWASYHPLRILRTRPAVRSLPSNVDLVHGIIDKKTAERITEARGLEMNLHMLAFHIDARPRRSTNSEDMNACIGAFVHRANGGAIYVLPDRLVDELDNTDCEEIRINDLKLPFPDLFLKFTPPESLFLAGGAPVDGCYIVKQGEEYLFSLTSYLDHVDYTRSLSVTCLDPTFSIHLPAPKMDLSKPGQDTELLVKRCVDLGIEEFLTSNAPPAENLSQTITRPDGTTAYFEDVRAESRRRRIEVFRSQESVFRACLNIVVNAACFISFRPDDIEDDWDCAPPDWIVEALNSGGKTRSSRDRKQHALRILSGGDYTRIKICGKKLFAEDSNIGHGISPRAHWRRGHWRRQRHGTGLSLMTPKWIRPTIVKKDNGPLVESRFYDVQTRPDGTPPTNP